VSVKTEASLSVLEKHQIQFRLVSARSQARSSQWLKWSTCPMGFFLHFP